MTLGGRFKLGFIFIDLVGGWEMVWRQSIAIDSLSSLVSSPLSASSCREEENIPDRSLAGTLGKGLLSEVAGIDGRCPFLVSDAVRSWIVNGLRAAGRDELGCKGECAECGDNGPPWSSTVDADATAVVQVFDCGVDRVFSSPDEDRTRLAVEEASRYSMEGFGAKVGMRESTREL